MKTRVIVYDSEMRKQAVLENAYNIGYEKKLNELWTASFSLPADDPKNIYCKPLTYVEIFDEGERVELFRITPIQLDKGDIQVNTYQCEHVLATLIDDVLFQYHEIGGVGIYTNTAINYVLSKQSVIRWVLGQNDFSRQFLYKWENENLLGSLFSIPKPFLENYHWTFDTTVFPWVINLIEIDENVDSYIRYKKNMQGIRREEDPTELCTRLYCLGYGEGVNQLTIEEVNNGLPYLDASTIDQFGIVARIFVDRRFEDVESLKARGQALLNELQVPRLTYEVDAADISFITEDPVDNFNIGTYTRVIDTELNLNIKALVVGISKNDLTGNPGSIKITIANKPLDIASSIAELADRQRINEVYSQGATNLNSHDFLDNCDPDFPAVMRFYIPEETVRINKMTLSYQTEAFRSYSRAIEGGGALTDTTSSGGGLATTTASGGGVAIATAGGGGITTSTASGGGTTPTSGGGLWFTQPGYSSGFSATTIDGDPPHTHAITVNHSHSVTIPNHSHNLEMPNHSHSVAIPNHQHSLNIPNHQHSINLPDHTHQIQYGIFEGPIPTELEVRVDGNYIEGLGTFENEVDIIPYLAKDGAGRIQRGWHEITITPNVLGRISASIVTQLFVQSRGGGDF